MLAGHIEICDGTVISGAAQIHTSIKTPGVYTSACPALPHEKWRRVASALRRLPAFEERFRRVDKDASEVRPMDAPETGEGDG